MSNSREPKACIKTTKSTNYIFDIRIYHIGLNYPNSLKMSPSDHLSQCPGLTGLNAYMRPLSVADVESCVAVENTFPKQERCSEEKVDHCTLKIFPPQRQSAKQCTVHLPPHSQPNSKHGPLHQDRNLRPPNRACHRGQNSLKHHHRSIDGDA